MLNLFKGMGRLRIIIHPITLLKQFIMMNENFDSIAEQFETAELQERLEFDPWLGCAEVRAGAVLPDGTEIHTEAQVICI